MRNPRIVSFLPSATEMIYLLGLENLLVGRSHECDYPQEASLKPVIVDCALDLSKMAAAEIDAAVGKQLSSGMSLYTVDEVMLHAAAPDLVVTQNLCQVCGPSGNEVSTVLRTMRSAPKIIWQNPHTFDDVLDCVRTLGRETGTEAKAGEWAESAILRVKKIAAIAKQLRRVRVVFLEWVDPIFCAGHWIPQMLEWAGGEDHTSRDGQDSIRITWEQIIDHRPEVIVVGPCGFKTSSAMEQAALLRSRPGWSALPAVQDGRVFAVDANAYFARPGPRLVDGVELLAHLIHPGEFAWRGPDDAYARVSAPAS